MAPRGGSGNGALPVTLALVRGQISPLSVPKPNLAPSTPGAGGSSAALLAALASASQGNGGSGAGEPLTGGRLTRNAPIARNPSVPSSPAGGQNPGSGLTAQPMTGSGGATPISSIPDPVIGTSSGPSEDSFAYFSMYVIDVDNGVVLFPGADQLATFSGHVDLEAQVSGATVSSYNWNTSDLAGANDISGTSTNQLTFQWEEENAGAAFTSSVTLSVTDTSSQIETYTYDFWVPSSNGGGGSSGGSGGSATWPAAITPESELITAPSFASDDYVGRRDQRRPRYRDRPAQLQPERARTGIDLRLGNGRSAADHPGREHDAGDGTVDRVGPVDVQLQWRLDLVLQHEQLEPRRRAADRTPGAQRRGLVSDRPLQLLGGGHRQRLDTHDAHRLDDLAQRDKQRVRRRLDPRGPRANHLGVRRRDPERGRKRQEPLVHGAR